MDRLRYQLDLIICTLIEIPFNKGLGRCDRPVEVSAGLDHLHP